MKKKDLNAFLYIWLANLIEQGHCIKADTDDPVLSPTY